MYLKLGNGKRVAVRVWNSDSQVEEEQQETSELLESALIDRLLLSTSLTMR